MSEVLKKPYEISLWDDVIYWRRQLLKPATVNENTYKTGVYYSSVNGLYELDSAPYEKEKTYYSIDESIGQESEIPFKEGASAADIEVNKIDDAYFYEGENLKPQVIFQYYKEKKVCVIGTHTMDSPIRAFSPKLTRNINGSSTLSFQMFYRYYDEEIDAYLDNPFKSLLVNERKVKLKYEDKWYDLIIKNVSENSDKKVITYTCQDMFITELSKTGFDIELNSELENNTGTVIDLATVIMDGTDWQVGEDPKLKQYKIENLYKIEVKNDVSLAYTELLSNEKKTEKVEKIYAFYNDIENEASPLQFLLIKDEDIKIDDDYVITNGINCEVETTYKDGAPSFAKRQVLQDGGEGLALMTLIDYQGKKLIKKEKTILDTKANKYVNICLDDKGNEVYEYTETEYLSPTAVKNYIANSADFTSTSGWEVGAISGTTQPTLELGVFPDWSEITEGQEVSSVLKFNANNNQCLVNSGINLNRSLIREFTSGEEYVFTIDAINTSYEFDIKISEFSLGSDGKYTLDENSLFSGTLNNKNLLTLTCNYSLSYTELLKKRIGIFIIPTSGTQILYQIKQVQFFPLRKYTNSNGEETIALPNDTFVDQALIKTKYYYYLKDQNYSSTDDINYLYVGYDKQDKKYVQQYHSDFTKIRSITASESNRFNLIQDLCEIFECWVTFETGHKENGEIKGIFKDGKYCVDKKVVFNEYRGQENPLGFRYGTNLSSITRTLDSAGIASKLIVKNNSNEFAKNGFCTIARSKENPSGENFIIDFGYYVQQGLVGLSEVTNDLRNRGTAQGYIGLYPTLKEQNLKRDTIIEEQASLMIDRMNYEADYNTWSIAHQEANEQLKDKNAELFQLTKKNYAWFLANKNDNPYSNNSEVISVLTAIARLESESNRYEGLANTAETNLNDANAKMKTIEEQLQNISKAKLSVLSRFYSKYSRFIQEGSWISEDYIDDNLYYLDAENTLHVSSQPKVTYTIKVLELSSLEGYEKLQFSVGDITYIEDTEFFGWVYKDKIKIPYREEIVVTEVTNALDSPEQNTIKVQNYKTQFEDLFQRITATTQSIEYATGRVNKAVNIVKEDGTIKTSVLENSMANNAVTLSNARDQSVVMDEYGITTTSLARPSEMLRLVSGGLFLSGDGGQNWTTGITARGINANNITSGSINTDVIKIMNGQFPTFVWNKFGLNAYKFDSNGIYQNNFVRFDQYGLYGIANSESSGEEFNPSSLEQIQKNASFSLTWDGLQLGARKNGGYIQVSDSEDFQVFKQSGDNYIERIKIGKLDNGSYGIHFKNNEGAITLQTDDSGNLNLSGYLGISTFEKNYKAKFGMVDVIEYTIKDENGNESTLNTNKILTVQGDGAGANKNLILNQNEAIAMYDDGTLLCKRLRADNLEGDNVKISGIIDAKGGKIGNLSIESVETLGYKVVIESSSDFAFSDGKKEITLTANVYDENNNQVDTTENSKYAFSYEWKQSSSGNPVGTEKTLTITSDKITETQGGAVTYYCYVTATTKESSGGTV